MVINTNVAAAFSQRVLSNSTSALSKSLSKLSTGSRIVTPDDDAAGLAVSMKFRAELKRIGAARSNVGNAVAFSQTQDGFLGTVDKALRRMSELAVLATDQTKSNTDVAQYEKEFNELKEFISRTSGKTFNGTGLFSATTLADKDLNADADTLDSADARISTQYTALVTANTNWVANPAIVANSADLTAVASDGSGVLTKASSGLEHGESVTVTIAGASTLNTATTYYVKMTGANTFTLHTDAALTSAAAGTSAETAITLHKKGDYSLLKSLRTGVADMAREWQQYATSSTSETDYAGAQTWEDVYDYWQGKIGNTWTGVRAHSDAFTHATGALPATNKFTSHELHVGNAAVLSDGLIEAYKKMVADIQNYVTNQGAGITVTDSSDASTYQLKGADVAFITSAIGTKGVSNTDTNAITDDLTKTNGSDYSLKLNTLINSLAGSRAYVGANMSRLGMVDNQLAVYSENLAAANSRIEDVDVATETSEFAKQQILVQSGTAMLAQANLLPQAALKLLQ